MPTKLTSLGGTGTGRPGKTLCDLPFSTIKHHNKRQLTPLCKSRFAKMMKVMSTSFFVILVALSWAVLKLQKGKSEEPSWTMEAVLIGFRDLSEISRGEGRWKTEEVCSLLSPSKGRVMKKKWEEKRDGYKKISHNDRQGMLQYYVLQEYKPHIMKIMTCNYFLTYSSTSIKWPEPPFGHPNESFVCCYLYQTAKH